MLGYKFRNNIKRDIDDTLAINKLYAPIRDILNDPTEMHFNDLSFLDFSAKNALYAKHVKECYESLLDFTRKKCGIFALSKNIDNELQWAYYADGHRGFCIEYDIDVIMESYNYSVRVKNGRLKSMPLVFKVDIDYQNSFPLFTQEMMERLTETNDYRDCLICTLGTKSQNWQHENEVRLVFSKSGAIELDYRAVKGIYFGCRFDNSSNEIERIMHLLKGRSIRYYQMKFIENSYILDYDEIPDKFSDTPKYIANNLPYASVKCTSIPELYQPNKDLIQKALELVSQEPGINKIKSSYISPPPSQMIAIEAFVNSDFVNPDIQNGNVKYYKFDIDFANRTITLRSFQGG